MNARERLEQLLVDEATEGLAEADVRQLEALLESAPETERTQYLLAAAAVDLAAGVDDEEPPAHLMSKVHHQAHGYCAARAAELATVHPFPTTPATPPPTTEASLERRDHRGRWWLAAAALALFALLVWPLLERLDTPPEGERATLETEPALVPSLTLALAATGDPAAELASGELRWSGELQRGEMAIRGLAVNDPERFQYQLWIFDQTRDERYPIDGGVFDMPAGAETVTVPFAAKLHAVEPTLFAITVEPPGGVVVSSRERIVLVAQVG